MTQVPPGRAVRVQVPATSANLGPGFDALGLALSLHDEVLVRTVPAGLRVEVSGEGAGEVPLDEDHLLVRSLRSGFEALGGHPPGLAIECLNRIPHARGLGSSAAAIVAGMVAARALFPGGEADLPDEALLHLAAELEGHPDNVAACLLGGLTIAWNAGGQARAARMSPAQDVQPVVFVPASRSSTSQARGLIPAHVSHSDAAFNAGRAALLVHALTADPSLLLAATEDRLHQHFRAPAMPGSAALVSGLRAAGVPAVISGAGGTVLALAVDGAVPVETLVALAGEHFTTRVLTVDPTGATARSVQV